MKLGLALAQVSQTPNGVPKEPVGSLLASGQFPGVYIPVGTSNNSTLYKLVGDITMYIFNDPEGSWSMSSATNALTAFNGPPYWQNTDPTKAEGTYHGSTGPDTVVIDYPY